MNVSYLLVFIYAGRVILMSESGTDGSQDEFSESFSFALANGALGVFEVHGRRIRDFRFVHLLKYILQN